MHTINEYVEAALRESGVTAEQVNAEEGKRLRSEANARFAGRTGRCLWERLVSTTSVRQDDAWTWIPSFLGPKGCLLFFDEFESDRVYAFQSGDDLVRMLHAAYGFEFYVTDSATDFLLAFNHHDYLIACGVAKPWLAERLAAQR